MNRRLATITLHWANVLCLTALLATRGQSATVNWTFAGVALALAGLAIVGGVMNGPGPKLQGILRKAHPWMARGLYAALALVALHVALVEAGVLTSGPSILISTGLLTGLGAAHAGFQLWRAAALDDGALRRMVP